MSCLVRPATLDDLPPLIAMGSAMHAESGFQHLKFNAKKTADYLVQALMGRHGLALFVAIDGDSRPVGAALVHAGAHWCSHDVVASDYAVYVMPEARQHGVAKALIDAYVVWAKAQGARHISIGSTTGVNTDQAGRLYQRMGFEYVGPVYRMEVE